MAKRLSYDIKSLEPNINEYRTLDYLGPTNPYCLLTAFIP